MIGSDCSAEKQGGGKEGNTFQHSIQVQRWDHMVILVPKTTRKITQLFNCFIQPSAQMQTKCVTSWKVTHIALI